jgi:Carboxypeptidase regulatory-like domain
MIDQRIVKIVVGSLLCVLLGLSLLPAIQGETVHTDYRVQNELGMGPIMDEDSVICGYVTDNETGDIVEDVVVDFYWEDSGGNNGEDSTLTDAEGFYHFHTEAVDFVLIFSHENYFQGFTFGLTVGENEICWMNFSLIPIPEQTVHIQGYITDNSSGEPVEGASILLYWNDFEMHYWENNTVSGASGYYSFASIPGRTQIVVDYPHRYFTYSTTIFTEDDSVVWLNISLVPYPAITVRVCGYITDADLGDPIPDVYVDLHCYTELGNFYNFTLSTDNGFYSIGAIPGDVVLNAHKEDYSDYWWSEDDIVENQTLWINLTLTFEPLENSQIQGFVVDNETHAVVRNARIIFDWKDDIGHFYNKVTFTDQTGYFSIMIPVGAVQCSIIKLGYTTQQTSWFPIEGHKEYWLNTTLAPEISALFVKPQPGIYINNETRFPVFSKLLGRFFPLSMPLIIGPLEIAVNITTSTQGCNRVEFFIDSTYCGTDMQEPFMYYWNSTGVLIQKHELQVIAYDNAGPCTIETITVRKVS